MTRKLKGPLIVILGISAAAGGTIAFASTLPGGGRGATRAEPPLERTLDYSETVPNLSSSKFILATDNDQASTTVANLSAQAIQNGASARTAVKYDDEPTPINETESRNATAIISTTIRIRAPTNGTPAKTE